MQDKRVTQTEASEMTDCRKINRFKFKERKKQRMSQETGAQRKVRLARGLKTEAERIDQDNQ